MVAGVVVVVIVVVEVLVVVVVLNYDANIDSQLNTDLFIQNLKNYAEIRFTGQTKNTLFSNNQNELTRYAPLDNIYEFTVESISGNDKYVFDNLPVFVQGTEYKLKPQGYTQGYTLDEQHPLQIVNAETGAEIAISFINDEYYSFIPGTDVNSIYFKCEIHPNMGSIYDNMNVYSQLPDTINDIFNNNVYKVTVNDSNQFEFDDVPLFIVGNIYEIDISDLNGHVFNIVDYTNSDIVYGTVSDNNYRFTPRSDMKLVKIHCRVNGHSDMGSIYDLIPIHQLYLKDLQPSTTYHSYLYVEDSNNNRVVQKVLNITNVSPSISITIEDPTDSDRFECTVTSQNLDADYILEVFAVKDVEISDPINFITNESSYLEYFKSHLQKTSIGHTNTFTFINNNQAEEANKFIVNSSALIPNQTYHVYVVMKDNNLIQPTIIYETNSFVMPDLITPTINTISSSNVEHNSFTINATINDEHSLFHYYIATFDSYATDDISDLTIINRIKQVSSVNSTISSGTVDISENVNTSYNWTGEDTNSQSILSSTSYYTFIYVVDNVGNEKLYRNIITTTAIYLINIDTKYNDGSASSSSSDDTIEHKYDLTNKTSMTNITFYNNNSKTIKVYLSEIENNFTDEHIILELNDKENMVDWTSFLTTTNISKIGRYVKITLTKDVSNEGDFGFSQDPIFDNRPLDFNHTLTTSSNAETSFTSSVNISRINSNSLNTVDNYVIAFDNQQNSESTVKTLMKKNSPNVNYVNSLTNNEITHNSVIQYGPPETTLATLIARDYYHVYSLIIDREGLEHLIYDDVRTIDLTVPVIESFTTSPSSLNLSVNAQVYDTSDSVTFYIAVFQSDITDTDVRIKDFMLDDANPNITKTVITNTNTITNTDFILSSTNVYSYFTDLVISNVNTIEMETTYKVYLVATDNSGNDPAISSIETTTLKSMDLDGGNPISSFYKTGGSTYLRNPIPMDLSIFDITITYWIVNNNNAWDIQLQTSKQMDTNSHNDGHRCIQVENNQNYLHLKNEKGEDICDKYIGYSSNASKHPHNFIFNTLSIYKDTINDKIKVKASKNGFIFYDDEINENSMGNYNEPPWVVTYLQIGRSISGNSNTKLNDFCIFKGNLSDDDIYNLYEKVRPDQLMLSDPVNTSRYAYWDFDDYSLSDKGVYGNRYQLQVINWDSSWKLSTDHLPFNSYSNIQTYPMDEYTIDNQNNSNRSSFNKNGAYNNFITNMKPIDDLNIMDCSIVYWFRTHNYQSEIQLQNKRSVRANNTPEESGYALQFWTYINHHRVTNQTNSSTYVLNQGTRVVADITTNSGFRMITMSFFKENDKYYVHSSENTFEMINEIPEGRIPTDWDVKYIQIGSTMHHTSPSSNLDEIAIFKGRLSRDDIRNLFDGVAANQLEISTTRVLKGYWNFNGNLYDNSGNGYHLDVENPHDNWEYSSTYVPFSSYKSNPKYPIIYPPLSSYSNTSTNSSSYRKTSANSSFLKNVIPINGLNIMECSIVYWFRTHNYQTEIQLQNKEFVYANSTPEESASESSSKKCSSNFAPCLRSNQCDNSPHTL